MFKILFLEDLKSDAELIWRELEKSKIIFKNQLVDNREDYLLSLKSFNPDIIISDYLLPQFDGMTALLLRNELTPSTPFILVTGSINEEVAVECMKAGADDYILKDNLSRLGPAILNSINKIKLISEKKNIEEELFKSELRLKKAQSIAHVGNWELDLSSRTVWCSEEALRIYGFDKESHKIPFELIQKSPLPEYRAVLDETFDRLLKYNEPYEVEFIIKRVNDGAIRSVYSKAEMVLTDDGELVNVIGVIQDITERMLAAEELGQSQQIIEGILNAMPVGVFWKDRNLIYLGCNAVFARNAGFSDPKEIIGKTDFQTGWHDQAEFYRRDDHYVIESGQSKLYIEESQTTPEGNTITFLTSKIPLRNSLGQISGVLGTYIDITERKRSEEALKESELRFKQIAEYSGEWIWEVDKDGRYTYSSPIVKEILGFEPEEIVNIKYFYDFFKPDETREQLKQAALDVFASKESFRNFTNVNIRKDGSEVILSTSGITLLDSNNNLTGYRGVDTDITERNKTEEIISQERRMLRTLIDNVPDTIYVKDIECRKVIANKADVRYIGFKNETDVLGKTDVELFPGQAGQRGYSDDKEIISTGKSIIELEEDFDDNDGGKHWLLTTKVPLRDKDGKIAGLVGIGHDITERKQVELELIRAKEKAEESDRLKTAFLHNISHEIRTPMNAIVGFSALLGEPDVDEQTRKDYIEVIMQGSDHLLSIITDIVDISNIETNLVKIEKNGIDVNLKLESLCNQFMPEADKKKINLVYENGLSDSDALIITDSTKLTQILSNLLSNALKFTDNGYIKLKYELKDSFLEFCITDTGIGIPLEYHTIIFDRFYKLQNTISRLYEGTGLGLAISKAYVELLGGTIWLSSEPGKGTSFFFTVPYEKQIIRSEPVKEKIVPEGFVFPVKKTILVAEDIDSNFKLVKFFLSGTNIDILRAENGKEAVEKFQSNKNIDLILMDVKMPVMDGYTAVKLIREKNSVIPIIAQTAYADDRETATENGCNGFLSKPFDRQKLLNVIIEYI